MSKHNPWFVAKEVIYDDFYAGKITASMDAKDVYAMEEHRDCFHAIEWNRFRDNFGRLKKRIQKNQVRAEEDLAGSKRCFNPQTGERHG